MGIDASRRERRERESANNDDDDDDGEEEEEEPGAFAITIQENQIRQTKGYLTIGEDDDAEFETLKARTDDDGDDDENPPRSVTPLSSEKHNTAWVVHSNTDDPNLAAVGAIVDGNDENPQSSEKEGFLNQNRGWTRKRIIFLSVALAVIIAAVGVGVGLTSGSDNEDIKTDTAPTTPTLILSERMQSALVAELQGLGFPSVPIEVWEDSNSPQRRAIEWLVDEDTQWQLEKSGGESAVADTTLVMDENRERLKTRYALAVLYFATGGGASNGSWRKAFLNPDMHECAWYSNPADSMSASSVFSQTSGCAHNIGFEEYGVLCDEATNTTVLGLWLGEVGLEGSLPNELMALSQLQILNLPINQLNGSLSDSLLSSWTQLRFLDLESNSLTGSIPASVGKLSALTCLSLHTNRLSGSIPTTIGNLTDLQVLILAFNALTGSMPTTIGNLTALQSLFLEKNKLTRTIPTTIGYLTALKELYLNNNGLTGRIPTTIGNLTDLQVLDLSTNSLTGPIPTTIGYLTALQYLFLRDNALTGRIPTTIGNLKVLQQLDLSINLLAGPIPTEIGQLVDLLVDDDL